MNVFEAAKELNIGHKTLRVYLAEIPPRVHYLVDSEGYQIIENGLVQIDPASVEAYKARRDAQMRRKIR